MGKAVAAGPEFYRGDGWQMVVDEPAQSLRVALFYRAALRSRMESRQFDARMAIAIGTIDFVPVGSVLLGEIKEHDNRMEAEYILIGTMMSFGFAPLAAYLTRLLLGFVG